MKKQSKTSKKRLERAENLRNLPPGNALVVVAHPDDETIWMGGTIRANPQVEWTIFSLCRASDTDREPKFRKVCAYYGAHSVMADVEDVGIMGIAESVSVFVHTITDNVPEKSFSYIFSHAKNGEYGHSRHRGVARAVAALLERGGLSGHLWYTFAYQAPHGHVVNDFSRATAYTKLTRGELREKRRVVKTLYGFSSRSFENVSCLPIETFVHMNHDP